MGCWFSADGIEINDCYARKKIITLDDITIKLISKKDLIKNKKSTNRFQDIADADILENTKRNPRINTKNASKLIEINFVNLYKNELNEEKIDMKKRKKDNQYYVDLEILNKTISIYNKADKTKSVNDILDLHISFKTNPLNKKPYENFKYKLSRITIYKEIEYRFKELLKDDYSYLAKG